jgi:altronate dehydratase small subunit
MKREALVIKRQDNVATAIKDISAGQTIQVGLEEDIISIIVINNIPYMHKFALRRITCGEKILKYGAVIGKASKNIDPGEHVHVHNVESLRGRGDLA